jgi:hypothetical protein
VLWNLPLSPPTLNRVTNVFHTIAAAAAMLKDVQLGLSVGDHVDSREIGPSE